MIQRSACLERLEPVWLCGWAALFPKLEFIFLLFLDNFNALMLRINFKNKNKNIILIHFHVKKLLKATTITIPNTT